MALIRNFEPTSSFTINSSTPVLSMIYGPQSRHTRSHTVLNHTPYLRTADTTDCHSPTADCLIADSMTDKLLERLGLTTRNDALSVKRKAVGQQDTQRRNVRKPQDSTRNDWESALTGMPYSLLLSTRELTMILYRTIPIRTTVITTSAKILRLL